MKKKTLSAAAWLTGSQIIARSLMMLRLMVLARLLGPEQLGLFGAVMLSISVLELLAETGVNSALIQKSGELESYLNTAWSITLVRGFFLAALMYLAAPYVASYFHSSSLEQPLQVMAIAPILTGLGNNAGMALLNKSLQFNRIAIVQIGSAIVELVVGVIAVSIYASVGALIAGRLLAMIYEVSASYILTDHKPRFDLNWMKFRELYKFGVWIFISNTITFILIKGGDLIVGKLLLVSSLGIYQMASNLSNLPTTELGRVITTISYPLYSKFQDDKARLRPAFLNSFSIIAVVVMFITALIIALSSDFVTLFLDSRWREVAPVMQWLCIWGACRALGANINCVFQAIGKPKLTTIYQATMLVLFGILIYPMTVWGGVMGVAITMAAVGVLVQVLRYPLVNKELGLNSGALYRQTLIPCSAAFLSVVVALLIRHLMMEYNLILRMLLCGVSIIAIYLWSLSIWNKFTSYNTFSSIISMLPERLRYKGATL